MTSLDTFFQNNRVLLAPMAGVSDKAFRVLCREQGADLTYTEMVSAKGLSYANEKTRNLLAVADGEERVAVQLFGHEPAVMAAEASWIEREMGETLAYLDINMGCPARKIVSKGDGSKLMCTPDLAREIIEQVVAAVDVPVTCKFRRGYEMDEELAVPFARMAERAGAAAVAVHGRFAMQYYRGVADWEVIAAVKNAVSIPVIGNGDIKNGEDILAMRDKTGCDAFMIGRAAEGNPWVFAQAKAALEGRCVPAHPTYEQRIAMARRHARLLTQLEGKNIVRMRKHAAWYMAGMPYASVARRDINSCASVEDFDRVFDALLQAIQEEIDHVRSV